MSECVWVSVCVRVLRGVEKEAKKPSAPHRLPGSSLQGTQQDCDRQAVTGTGRASQAPDTLCSMPGDDHMEVRGAA